MKVIEIKKLKKYYGEARGVEEASLDLHQGEILGFVGPNGAGKSTVIRVLMGLINKTSGTVKIFGEEPSHKTNARIGYLPSEVFMYSELIVLDQLKYFARVRGCDETRIYELAGELDLDLTNKIKKLSFGNKKKVGIVAALMHSPEILILDEPTSGLDPLIQQRFFNILLEEKKKGTAILLSSHVLNEVEKVCDRVSLIKEGAVLFSDTIANVKENQYKKIYISPIIDLNLEKLQHLSTEKNQIIYSYSGNINILIKELGKFQLEQLRIVDLELEEIFMHYYQKGEE
jgi:ABC-2 type transport system ATP-binding protein